MPRITFEALLTLAKSSNDKDRKQGFMYFNAWVKQAANLRPSQRLTKPERDVLQQLFAERGFKVARK